MAHRFPGADAALLSGSTVRGTATAGSDLDLVVLFPHLPAGAHRLTEIHDGTLVEAFVHDLETLRYFLAGDQRSGVPVLANMVAEGIAVSGLPSEHLQEAKSLAGAVLRSGPPSLAQDELDRRRYAISNLVDDLQAPRTAHQRLAIAAELYTTLADFALRAAGRFGGRGKGVVAALQAYAPDLASRFEPVFTTLLVRGEADGVAALVETILAPHGGRLVEGYAAQAPDDWRLPAETKPSHD